MYKNIVVAIDGSDFSTKAMIKALEIGTGSNGKVTALYIINPGIYGSSIESRPIGITDPAADKIVKLLTEESEAILKRAQDEASEFTCDKEFVSRIGDARDEILDYADEVGADLIVVGSTGKGITKRLILGSVSSAIVAASKRDVLVVR